MNKATAALVVTIAALNVTTVYGQAAFPVPVVERPAVSQTLQGRVPNAASGVAASSNLSHQAELLMMVEQLQEEVRYLRGQVEEQNYRMKKMRVDQRDRYRDLDRRIQGLTTQMSERVRIAPPLSSRPAAVQSTNAAISKQSTQSFTGQSSVQSSPTQSIADQEAYKKAFALVRQRSYGDALKAFEEFRRFYPDSALVPNTFYWSGEVLRAKAEPDYSAAKDSYLQLVERFPQHQKAADGYYKLGLSYDNLGDKAKAIAAMKKLISLYPNQSSAKLAQRFLDKN